MNCGLVLCMEQAVLSSWQLRAHREKGLGLAELVSPVASEDSVLLLKDRLEISGRNAICFQVFQDHSLPSGRKQMECIVFVVGF